MAQVVFILLPKVNLLDLAGPVEAFFRASEYGADYQLRYAAVAPSVRASSGLKITELSRFDKLQVNTSDLVFVPGIQPDRLQPNHMKSLQPAFYDWLRGLHERGVRLCSICTGAFVIASAGLLDHRTCTTHWRYLKSFKVRFPEARVLANRLFAKDDSIYTSAGVTSGIDLALSIIEEDYGPILASKIARALVVYVRRDGSQSQMSVYLDYRSHLNPGIHKVQSWIANHPAEKCTIESLSTIAAMSPRHLTRVFKQETGITIKEYAHRLKFELARNLMNNPEMTIDAISRECGFDDPRQFRRLWKVRFGRSPSASREWLTRKSIRDGFRFGSNRKDQDRLAARRLA